MTKLIVAFRNFANTPKKKFLNLGTLPYIKHSVEGRHRAFCGKDVFLFITMGHLKKIRRVSYSSIYLFVYLFNDAAGTSEYTASGVETISEKLIVENLFSQV